MPVESGKLPFKHAFSWGHPGQLPYFPTAMFQQFYPYMPPQAQFLPPQKPLPRLKKLDVYELDLNEQIGTGFSSVVYKAIDTRTSEVVCIKAVDYVGLGPIQKSMVVNEIKVMKAVDSENAIKCLDVLESSNFCYIISEYCEGGDLYQKIKKQGVLDETVACEYMKGIARALKALK